MILFVSTTAAGGGSTRWNKQLLPFAVRLASVPATAFNKGAEKNALTVCIAKTKDEMQFEHNRMHGLCCSRGQKAACQFLCDNLTRKSQAKTHCSNCCSSDRECIQNTHVTGGDCTL